MTGLEHEERESLLELAERARRTRLPEPVERRRIRVGAGVSVAELANALHASETILYQWEKGRRMPSPRFRGRYAEALEILAGEQRAVRQDEEVTADPSTR